MILKTLFAFLLFAQGSTECPQVQETKPPSWQVALETKLESFAQRPLLANEADRVLAQVSQNPHLQVADWLRSKGLEDANPLRLAQKWRTYYLQNHILAKFPTPNPQVNQLVEDLFRELRQELLQPRWQEVQTALSKSQSLIATRWSAEGTPAFRDLLQNRGVVRLHDWQKLRGSGLQNQVQRFLFEDLFWSQDDKELIVGLPFLSHLQNDQGDLRIVWEMAHIASPRCQGRNLQRDPNSPFQSVIQCLSGQLDGLPSASCGVGWASHPLAVSFADWWTAEVILASEQGPIRMDKALCSFLNSVPNDQGQKLRLPSRRALFQSHPRWKGQRPTGQTTSVCKWLTESPASRVK